MSKERIKRVRRSGLGVIPSLFTMGNLFCGYVSITMSFHGRFTMAALLICIAAACDALDGRVARLLKADSSFGEQLDSLADVLSFGAAPALLLYHWGFSPLAALDHYIRNVNLGILCSFFFVVCGAARLARFNATLSGSDPRYFVGLPIPAGAGAIALPVLFSTSLFGLAKIESLPLSLGCLAFAITVSLLMVSNVRYPTFKDFTFKSYSPTRLVLTIGTLFILITMEPRVLVALFLVYLGMGPFNKVFGRSRQTASQTAETETSPES